MDPPTRRRQLVIRGATMVVAMSAWVFARFICHRSSSRRGISYGPLTARDRVRNNNLRFIYHSDDRRCVELLRMRRAPFFQLCSLFRDRGLLRDSVHTNIEEQVAMFLLVAGHNERFRVLTTIFRRSLETISRYFKEVLYVVGELRGEMICPPSAVPTKILHSGRWNPFFKDCVGSMDGTHVLAKVPEKFFMAKFNCYVVFEEYNPRVYRTWAEYNMQISGFKHNLYQGYTNYNEAVEAFEQYKFEKARALACKEAVKDAVKESEKKQNKEKPAWDMTFKDMIIAALVVIVFVQFAVIFKL